MAIEYTGLGNVLLQQPFPDPLSLILGQKALVERLPLEICEATAARQSGEDGNEAVPEQSVGVATGTLHIPPMVTVALVVGGTAYAAVNCVMVQLRMVTVAPSGLCFHTLIAWGALDICVQTMMRLQYLHAEAAIQMCDTDSLLFNSVNTQYNIGVNVQVHRFKLRLLWDQCS